jgi:hypothetical protein
VTNETPANAKGQKAEKSLVDELGIKDLSEPVVGGRGRLFSAAGRNSPVVEFTNQFVVMHPPQKPYEDTGPSEVITRHSNAQGILLDELGIAKKIPGAKFQGHQLYWLGEQKPGTLRHFTGWIDDKGTIHKLYVHGDLITTDIAFRLRNKTHDGELSIFPDLKSN